MKALILCQDIKTKVACRGNLKTNNKKYNVYTKIKSKGSLYESSNIETEKMYLKNNLYKKELKKICSMKQQKNTKIK